jgi:hypothetical protein
LFLFSLVLFAAPVAARTFYVDPATGQNSNDGRSASTPWQNPPGTRLANDSDFWSTAWGTITSSNKIACGDVILLKGGATQTSAQGGAWRLSGDTFGTHYYPTTCTNTSRIVLRVATSAEWTGSTGSFTLDATGVSGTNSQSCAGPGPSCGIISQETDFLTVGGVSSSQRLRVINGTGTGTNGVLLGQNSTRRGLRLQWFEVSGAPRFGVLVRRTDGVLIRQGIIHDTARSGINVGNTAVPAGKSTRVGIEDVEIYRTGGSGGGTSDDALFLTDCLSCWAIRMNIHHNAARGVNTGAIDDLDGGGTYLFRFRDHEVWFNGTQCALFDFDPATQCTGNGTSTSGVEHCCTGSGTGTCITCAGGGFDVSGRADINQPEGCPVDPSINIIERMILWRNIDIGTFFYSNALADIWHWLAWGNLLDAQPGGGDLNYTTGADRIHYHNGISQRRSYNGNPWRSASSGGAAGCGAKLPVATYNLFAPISANTETLATFDFSPCTDGTSPTGATRTYASGNHPCWIGATNRVGSTEDPAFADTSGCDADPSGLTFPSTCDFRLGTGSAAIDAGTWFMRASGAGTNETTISVLGNGAYSDPRYYFIAPWDAAATSDIGMYLDSVGDTIEIQGCGERTITSMTSTGIAFTPACSWGDGAGVHLAYQGTAPDLGPHESGESGRPAAPALISVTPVP